MQPDPANDLLYLLRILESMAKIHLYATGFNDPYTFFDINDGKEADACLMQLAQIGEQAAKISEMRRKRYEGVNWQQVRGFRNRIVHDYTGLDRFTTFTIIKARLPALKPVIIEMVRDGLNESSFSAGEWQIAQTSPYLRHVNFKEIEQGTAKQ